MLPSVSILFPVADQRAFAISGLVRLPRPGWPLPDPGCEFVRSFGRIRVNARRTVSGWAGEPYVASAARALRIPTLEHFAWSTSRATVKLVCRERSIFCDGRALCKVELGFDVRPSFNDSAEDDGRELLLGDAFLHAVLEIPLEIPSASSDGTAGCRLAFAGRDVARLYAVASSRNRQGTETDSHPGVSAGVPMLLVEFARPSERCRGARVATFERFQWWRKVQRSDGVRLHFSNLLHKGTPIPVWAISVPQIATSRQRAIANKLRVFLCRLHAEREVLRLVLQAVTLDKLGAALGDDARNVLAHYLRDGVRRIRRNTKHAEDMIESSLAPVARAAWDHAQPGGTDLLLAKLSRLRIDGNIRANVADFVRSNADAARAAEPIYDAFLSYASPDREFVKTVASALRKSGLRAWFDEEDVPPGDFFQDHIQQGISSATSAAIFIGVHGLGPWETAEARSILARSIEDGMRVVPVLLPGVDAIPQPLRFLRDRRFVKLSAPLHDGDLRQLVWGLTGKKPRDHDGHVPAEESPRHESFPPRTPMDKHTILFLAANPLGTDHLALDREARAILGELASTGHRDRFQFVTRWAAEPLDLLRALRTLKPTVVHFSGHGDAVSAEVSQSAPTRDGSRHGLYFQNANGEAQWVPAEALADAFGAAGASVQLVVLSACHSDVQAAALLTHVPCVVGMTGGLDDAAARHFAAGFYGGLGDGASVAEAFQHGRAAISMMGHGDENRPRLETRADLDANRLILAARAPAAVRTAPSGGTATAPETPNAASEPRAMRPASGTGRATTSPARLHVDVGILTIRPDEFRAVLDCFPDKAGPGVYRSPNREYTLRHADAGHGERYTVAALRQIEQGTGEAQDAAHALLHDLAPRLVLVVGIAGGLPSDISLGDVVVATRIHDLTIEAREAGGQVTYDTTGGPIDRRLAGAVANLEGRDEIAGWSAGLPPRPAVTWADGQTYGPDHWQDKLRNKLAQHHGVTAAPRGPIYLAGPIASSDRLVKDPAVLFPWITTTRNLLAVEMESGGVYRALRERCPMLPIRGISDIVGLQRSEAWIGYACASAAAFAAAFLRTRPVPVGDAVASDSS